MATYTDALTGSGDLGANFTVTGTWARTASGARQTTATGAYRKAAYTAAPMDSDFYRVTATVAYDSDGGIGMGVAVCWAAGSTMSGYVLIRFANEVYWVELNAGAETTVALVSTPGTGSVELALEFESGTLRSYVNGALVDTRSDATYSTRVPGLVAYGGGTSGTDNYATNWEAQDQGAAATSLLLHAQPRAMQGLIGR